MKLLQLFCEQDGKTPSSRRFIGIVGFLTLIVAIAFDICCNKSVDSTLIDALVWIVGLAMTATTASGVTSRIGLNKGKLQNKTNIDGI